MHGHRRWSAVGVGVIGTAKPETRSSHPQLLDLIRRLLDLVAELHEEAEGGVGFLGGQEHALDVVAFAGLEVFDGAGGILLELVDLVDVLEQDVLE